MRQIDVHPDKKKPLPDIYNVLRDKKDSVVLTEKVKDQRAEQRLRYHWPIQFTKGVNEKITRGQIVDVSSKGLAMLCHADKQCPRQNQLVNIDFGVPHFGLAHSLDVVFFNRIGRVCRVDNLSNIVNRIAVQFAEPLFFEPGQQNISKSDAQQILRAKIQSITKAEEKAKFYGEALDRAEEKLKFYAEAKDRAEERAKTETTAREMLEEKLKAQAESIAELQKTIRIYAQAKDQLEEIAKIEARARDEIEEKIGAEAELILELQKKVRAYEEAKTTAEEKAKAEIRAREKAEENVRAEIQKGAVIEAQMQDKVKSYADQIIKIKAQATESVLWAKAEAEYAIAKAKDRFEHKIDVYAGEISRAGSTSKSKTNIRRKAAVFIVLMIVVGTFVGLYPKHRDKPIDYYNRGSIHLQKNEYDRAIFDYTKVLEIAPKMDEAYYNRGNAYNAKGWYNQAIADYTRATQINPRFAGAYYNKGCIYFNKGQYDQAILDCNKAIEINPRLAKAYYNRGLSYGMKGEYDQAILDYTEAVEIEPTMTEAYYNRGNAYAAKDQYDQAALDYTKAVDINPKFSAAYYSRALAYYHKKEYDKAWQDVHKTESLGYVVHPIFLKDLQETSGRTK